MDWLIDWLIDWWRKWCSGESASRASGSVGSCLLSQVRRCLHQVGVVCTENELVCYRLWFIAVLLSSNADMVMLKSSKPRQWELWPLTDCVHECLVRASAWPELACGVRRMLFPHLLHQELDQSFDEAGKFQRWNLFLRVSGAC